MRRHIRYIRQKFREKDLFELCLVFSIVMHGIAGAAYIIKNLPSFSEDESVMDAKNLKFKDVEVDFIDVPLSVPLGGDSNPAPVEKAEWIEGTGTDKPDAANTDVDINKLSGDGTDEDGYMFADLADRPPVPIIDFDLNRYFPQEAKTSNIRKHTVIMQFQVEADGSLKKAIVVSPPSGYGFDEAAMKVAGKLRFRPGKAGGKPVKMVFQIPITFELE